MIGSLAARYKNWRRKKVMDALVAPLPGCNFAFIGIGQHSLDNLYPVLLRLGVPVRYIYSRQLPLAQQAARLFPACTGVNDLSAILQDDTIKGVFICTKNEYQLPLVKTCLEQGKYVFVEKPGVTNYAGWEELTAHRHANRCMIAFNKRFNPVNAQFQKDFNKAFSYQARYVTGPYPEGNAVMELFCHPVDNVLQLFGPVKEYYFTVQQVNGGVQVQLLLQHARVTGTMELSTCYAWSSFADQLQCVTPARHVAIDYPGTFVVQELGYRPGGIPVDKILKRTGRAQVSNATGAVPVAANNSIWQHGYYQEVACFVEAVQQGKSPLEATPDTFEGTFRLLEAVSQGLGK
ncbi:Gfo/Idh/MocA family protein [Chitinophaga eiseniae]|uniref:Gfo/Idh/MocA family oxidoreductase n=1 Tax=Chitinophaga eiseniae TaxID=634771 RepID=A0A847SEZ6_9BACT|nr:Gfo/Idh/MocA family oxidoreductase [Chitinophaga eiseniae]NLR77407.1 Gfo/Idh/MocA family oxidoreductase [Chitinophaga eiseniae]